MIWDPDKTKAVVEKPAQSVIQENVSKEVPAKLTVKETKSGTGLKVLAWTMAAVLAGLIGIGGSSEFLSHITVFVLACFVGFMLIWNVSPALHTPLMSVTNAISGIIVIGGMIHLSGDQLILPAIAVLIATINIVGGFMVTHRMLQMFRK